MPKSCAVSSFYREKGCQSYEGLLKVSNVHTFCSYTQLQQLFILNDLLTEQDSDLFFKVVNIILYVSNGIISNLHLSLQEGDSFFYCRIFQFCEN